MRVVWAKLEKNLQNRQQAMKLLFVHQNFAGQYREILDWLIAQGGHEIVFLTQRKNVAPRD